MLSYNCLWINKCDKRSIIYKGRESDHGKDQKAYNELKGCRKIKRISNDSACYDIIFSVGCTDLDSSDSFKYREDHEGLVSVIGISAGFRDNDCEIQNQTVSASGRIR